MANVKISNLTAASTPVAGTEVLPIVQSGATVKVSIANLTPGLDTITAAKGGTGQTSYAVGDLLYASTTTALSKLADVATGNALISGGVNTAPSWGKIGLTTHVSGTLPTANGGTNLTSFTANGVMYASSTSALTTGSVLTFDGAILGVNGVSVGRGAGAVSTNTAVGASALSGSVTGGNNVAIGYQALRVSTSGSGLTSVGTNSLLANTTGADNSAFGIAALAANTTGNYNTGIGREALQANTTASNNTAVGYQAGYSNVIGGSQTFVGYKAGYSSAPSSAGAGFNTGVGYLSLQGLTTGVENTAIGDESGYSLTTGTYNAFMGTGAGFSITTGSKNSILGSYNGNQGGLDIRTASNYIVLSDGDGNPRLWHSGSFLACPTVYSVTTASTPNVFVDSSGGIYRGGVSALKYKQDIRDLEEIDISLIRAVRYKSKCEIDDQTKDYFGVVADQVAEAGIEELVTRGADGEVEGFQYERLTVVLLKKLQVLEAEVKALKGQA